MKKKKKKRHFLSHLQFQYQSLRKYSMHDEEKKRREEEEGYIDKKIEPRRRMKIKGYRLREGIGQKLKELARGRRLADVSRNVD